MEDNVNLLDDYTQPELDVNDYRNSYKKIRMISVLTSTCAFFLYAIFMDKTTGEDDGVAYRLGSAFGIVLIIAIPASFLAALLAIIIDREFPYKERFKKLFWGTALWLSTFLVFCIGLIIATEKKIF